MSSSDEILDAQYNRFASDIADDENYFYISHYAPVGPQIGLYLDQEVGVESCCVVFNLLDIANQKIVLPAATTKHDVDRHKGWSNEPGHFFASRALRRVKILGAEYIGEGTGTIHRSLGGVVMSAHYLSSNGDNWVDGFMDMTGRLSGFSVLVTELGTEEAKYFTDGEAKELSL